MRRGFKAGFTPLHVKGYKGANLLFLRLQGITKEHLLCAPSTVPPVTLEPRFGGVSLFCPDGKERRCRPSSKPWARCLCGW
ncbi:hypothetical protein D3C78_1499540 [compost metagenome]